MALCALVAGALAWGPAPAGGQVAPTLTVVPARRRRPRRRRAVRAGGLHHRRPSPHPRDPPPRTRTSSCDREMVATGVGEWELSLQVADRDLEVRWVDGCVEGEPDPSDVVVDVDAPRLYVPGTAPAGTVVGTDCPEEAERPGPRPGRHRRGQRPGRGLRRRGPRCRGRLPRRPLRGRPLRRGDRVGGVWRRSSTPRSPSWCGHRDDIPPRRAPPRPPRRAAVGGARRPRRGAGPLRRLSEPRRIGTRGLRVPMRGRRVGTRHDRVPAAPDTQGTPPPAGDATQRRTEAQ